MKADRVLSTGTRLRQLHRRGRTKPLRRSRSCVRRRTMATSHEIRNGLDSSESNMGVGRATNREKSATLQIGFSVQICIRLGKTQIQSSARHEGLQTRTWGRLRQDILSCSQDHHPLTPTGGCGNRRPRARATRRENDIPTRRHGREHIHVSIGRFLGDAGRAPRGRFLEKPFDKLFQKPHAAAS